MPKGLRANQQRQDRSARAAFAAGQGTVDANLALSQKRAEAVAATLVTDHKIDAARLRACGVANFSPVTRNGSEAGRAKNRRVELVEQ